MRHSAICGLIILALLSFAEQISAKTVYPFVFAPSTGLFNDVEKPYRQEICLNGFWDFQPLPTPPDYHQGSGVAPVLPTPTAQGWSNTKIKIPSPWNINSFAFNDLEGPDHRNYPSYPKEWDNALMGWLKRTTRIPAEWSGNRIKLHFEAVAGETTVYVNGCEVGHNFDLFLPFECDITDVVTPGEMAEILVGVRSQKLFEDNSTVGRRIIPAGSMWGYHINGIWQDVTLIALPQISVSDVFIKPLVSENRLEADVEIVNASSRRAKVELSAQVKEWIGMAGTDINTAPEPRSKLGATVLEIPATKITVGAADTVRLTISCPVNSALAYWSPEHPNLYGLVVSLKADSKQIDTKYDRFGWREWTLCGDKQLLNGKPYTLRSDSWHFQGIPQMTRRYAWAWFKAIKDMNGNAVRPHAQVYPRFYLDMADEMGICILAETANWASDGGPKLDSPLFWENSLQHLSRMVCRDRNHTSIFGWSISNENKPVILYVFNRPDLMPLQVKAWQQWRDTVRNLDPTRPWISADGEDDGDGILPVTVGHYGDSNSMAHWKAIGKPWGMGEHSMAYYGTPEQVSAYNGERAYESQLGRMEGIANECYNLIRQQRCMGASFSTIFNMAWYGLEPLPLGKSDISVAPSLTDDGIFFADFTEGMPGVQPERIGPYSTTFNPGYDPNLPLYRPWPLFDALRAANAPDSASFSNWGIVEKCRRQIAPTAEIPYSEVVYLGSDSNQAKQTLDAQGVVWSKRLKHPHSGLVITDGSQLLSDSDKKTVTKALAKGADLWIWGLTPEGLKSLEDILPGKINLIPLSRSSFLTTQRYWTRQLNHSDFYFCELQKADASRYALAGQMADDAVTMLEACRTDWRRWNQRPEELKTAATLRSENECPQHRAVFIRYSAKTGSNIYISTLSNFANSGKGFNTLSTILHNAGIKCRKQDADPNEIFFLRDGSVRLPPAAVEHITSDTLTFYAFTPRPLDDLLIEPNVPKLDFEFNSRDAHLLIGSHRVDGLPHGESTLFSELPLKQGWNRITVILSHDSDLAKISGSLICTNNASFISSMKFSFTASE